MDLGRFLRYVALFNGQDWDSVCREFYAPRIRIEFPVVVLSGRDEAMSWFRRAHESLFETLMLGTVDIRDDGALIVANLRVQFILLGPTDYSPTGEPGQAGDIVEVPMKAQYEVDESGLFKSLIVTFTGPPQKGRITAS